MGFLLVYSISLPVTSVLPCRRKAHSFPHQAAGWDKVLVENSPMTSPRPDHYRERNAGTPARRANRPGGPGAA